MDKTTKKNIPDQATYKRIWEHLSNPNDIITDEDIRNAKTDLPVSEVDDNVEPGQNELIET